MAVDVGFKRSRAVRANSASVNGLVSDLASIRYICQHMLAGTSATRIIVMIVLCRYSIMEI